MRYLRYSLAIVMLIGLISNSSLSASANSKSLSTDTISIVVDFPINQWKIDRSWAENDAALTNLTNIIRAESISSARISMFGSASPDGLPQKNLRLANLRLNELKCWLTDSLGIDSAIITTEHIAIDWNLLRKMLNDKPFEGSNDALEIISTGSDFNDSDILVRNRKLRALNNGSVWSALCRDFFPNLRNAKAKISLWRQISLEPTPEASVPVVFTTSEDVDSTYDSPADNSACHKGWSVRTSIPAWAVAVANIAAEYRFAQHLSASLSLAYSAWDLGAANRKFRTFQFRPELRYWPSSRNKGVFVESHLAMIAYNVALPSWNYRIQDHKGTHPALGGGIGVGYRTSLFNSAKWSFEAAVGVGGYVLNYDRFENQKNGPLVDQRKRSFFGVDHLELSIVYSFNQSAK